MEVSKKVLFIRDWILNYANSMPTKAKSLVIGISGGIDSSVSSTLSAMTGLKTIAISMPIKQKSNQHDLSLKHQEWLKKNFKNVEGITVELDNLFSTFENTFGITLLTLKIGDLIFTGTPSGVSEIKKNDIIEGYIENKKAFEVTVK